MPKPLLSVIIPVYNEAATLPALLQRVKAVPIEKELIIVDDGSTDETTAFLENISNPDIMVLRHSANQGKGAAIRTALPHVTGRFVIIQDGDLEYDPMDYLSLIEENCGKQTVIYGSRILSKMNERGPLAFWLGRIVISKIANALYGLHLTDVYTCYKLFPAAIIKSLRLDCTGFEFCAEVTARIANKGIPIKEVPIGYTPRTFRAGKKIRWMDGLKAVWTLIKYRLAH